MSPLERLRFIRELRVPRSVKAVLWGLNAYTDKDGICWPSRRLLAEESGFSYGAIYEAIGWLRKAGLILRVPRPGRSAITTLAFEQYQYALTTPSATDVLPRQPLTPKQYKGSRAYNPRPKLGLTESPRFDASCPPDRRCPICGAASADLRIGGRCFLHRKKPAKALP